MSPWLPAGHRLRSLGDPAAPIVCLHGSLWDSRVFAPLLDRWNPQETVWAYDLPGHGRSPLPPEAVLTLSHTVSLLAAAFDRDGIRGARVIGHSWGGMVGIALAHAHPGLVRELHVMGITLAAESPALLPEFRRLNHQVRQHGSAVLTDLLMAMFFAPSTLSDPTRSEECLRWRKSLGGYKPEIASVLAGIIERPDLTAMAKSLRIPITLIDGAHDQRFDAAMRAANRAALPAARWAEIPAVGHMALIEGPEAIANCLRSFGFAS